MNDSVESDRVHQETLDDLLQARRELARDQQFVQEQLATEMLQKLAGKLKSLADQQKALIKESNRIEQEFLSRKRWSRALLKSLQIAANTQQFLQEDVNKLARQLETTEVVEFAMLGVARNMKHAVTELRARNVSSVTRQFQNSAHRRLLSLIDVLQAGNQQAHSSEPDLGGGSPGQAQENSAQKMGSYLTLLRLIKSLQQELLNRTEELQKGKQSTTKQSQVEKRELEYLSEEQQRLSELTQSIIQSLGK